MNKMRAVVVDPNVRWSFRPIFSVKEGAWAKLVAPKKNLVGDRKIVLILAYIGYTLKIGNIGIKSSILSK